MRTWLLLFLGAGATAATWQAMLSPGPLVRAHDAFAGDCDECHVVFDGIPDARCLDCHQGLAERILGGRGFHASVDGKACITCHEDHHGLDAPGTRAEALAAFDHASTGFPVDGAHRALGCDDCHTGPIGEVVATCGGCHEDEVHQSALGPECELCHVTAGWSASLKTASAHLLSMEGRHGQQTCGDCHEHGANLAGDVPCVDCHGEAHDGIRTPCDQCHQVTGFTPAKFDHGPCTCAFAGKHQTAPCLSCHPAFDFSDTPTLCTGCHTKDRKHDDLGECSRCHTETSWEEDVFDHNGGRVAFRVEGAHLEVGCSQCHLTPGRFRGAATTCEGCHRAQGDAAHGDFGPCATCHTVAGFAPSTFDHATTGLALDGRHAEITCQDCHASKVQGYPR